MFEYTLIRSARKTLAIEVHATRGILVRAPRNVSARTIDAFVQKNEAWIVGALEKQARRTSLRPQEPDADARAELIRRATELLPARVDYYARRMRLNPTGITITGAKTRFGSCSPKNRLSFSWRLMLYPDCAIDYVVVHELAHILYKNHGAAFYAFVESVLPDYKARQLLLNPK